MQRVRCEERCHSVPSPLAGEGKGGGYNKHSGCFHPMSDKCRSKTSDFRNLRAQRASRAVRYRHPPPCPSPARGEGTVCLGSSHLLRRVVWDVHSLARRRGPIRRSEATWHGSDNRNRRGYGSPPSRGRQRLGLCQKYWLSRFRGEERN